jgi:hypothetical protein
VHLGVPFELVLAALLIGLIVIALVANEPRTRAVVPIMVATSLVAFLYSGYKRWHSAGYRFLWPHGIAWTDAAHYMILPTLLLLSALVVQLDARPRVVSPASWSRARAVTLAVVVVAALVSFDVSDPSRGSSTWLQAVNVGRSACLRSSLDSTQVLINPGYVSLSMQVPCSTLVGARAPRFPVRSVSVMTPSSNATVSGTTLLRAQMTDSVHVSTVVFTLLGSHSFYSALAKPMLTSRGWTALWRTTTVHDGTYHLQAVASYSGGDLEYSPPVRLVVKNRIG